MKLHTDQLPWDAQPARKTDSSAVAFQADVLVIGAGVSGALVTSALLDEGLKVLAVDRRPLAAGSTAASTALVQADLDQPLLDLGELRGKAEAQGIYKLARATLEDLRQIVQNPTDPQQPPLLCDFIERPSLYLAAEASMVPRLQAETLARRSIGLQAEYLNAQELADQYGVVRAGAIRSTVAYEMDPVKFTRELWARNLARGARLSDDTPIELEISAQGQAIVRTTDGRRISCREVVLAGGYESVQKFPGLRGKCELTTSFAIATAPLAVDQLWPTHALMWDTGEPYFYCRTTADGRILAGGFDVPGLLPADTAAIVAQKTTQIHDQLRATLPKLPVLKIERSWAAVFASAADGLPLIGRPEDVDNLHLALGAGGNGMLFSTMAAKLIANDIAGRSNPAAGWFRPNVSLALARAG